MNVVLYRRDESMGQGKSQPMILMGLFATKSEAHTMVMDLADAGLWPDAYDAYVREGDYWWRLNDKGVCGDASLWVLAEDVPEGDYHTIR